MYRSWVRKLTSLILVAGLLFGGWYFASPWFAMQGIVDAAQDRDTSALEERIDFAGLREGTNSQLRGAIDERTRDGNALEQLGGMIAGEIAESAVGAALTPRGIVNIVTVGSFTLPLVPERYRGEDLEWDVDRTSFDTFEGVSTWEDGTEGPKLLFTRDGIGWDLTGVQLADWQ